MMNRIEHLSELRGFIKYKNEMYILNTPINVISDDDGVYFNIPSIDIIASLVPDENNRRRRSPNLDDIIDKSIIPSYKDLLNKLKVKIGNYSYLSYITLSLAKNNQIDMNYLLNNIFNENLYPLVSSKLDPRYINFTNSITVIFPRVQFVYWNYVNNIKNEKL